jgi:4-amino-4-deoxy-L-arabinose transferase-like glycosyltransferase
VAPGWTPSVRDQYRPNRGRGFFVSHPSRLLLALLPVKRGPIGITLSALLIYLFVSLNQLSVFPPVGEDEPWIAAASYKLARDGVYGSDLFKGHYGMERHVYEHMPVYSLLQAGVFRLFGVGVVQMRLLSVAFGAALAVAVWAVGCQIAGERAGALAAVLMIGLRLADGGDATGILLLDRARISRYDIAVPVFGLLALIAFNRAERTRARAWYATTGALAGVSSLSHLYGLFWMPVFVLVIVARQGRRSMRDRALWMMLVGFAAVCAAWVAFVVTGWSDYLAQMRPYSDRFDLFNPSFYLTNAVHEIDRYRFIYRFAPDGNLRLARPGFWTALFGIPAAVAAMLWYTKRQRHDPVFALAVASIVQVSMFTILLSTKSPNYVIALWPLGVLSIAWFGLWLWNRWPDAYWRAGLVVLLSFILIEGGSRVRHAQKIGRQTTSYDWFESQVAACIPADSLVLGFQHYWLGLRQFSYRTWLLPLAFANPVLYHDAVSFDRAIERVDPDVVLVDRHWADLIEATKDPEHPYHSVHAGFEAFTTRHQMEPLCVVRDRTYGTMEVYRVR